jgi:hypothetical protein
MLLPRNDGSANLRLHEGSTQLAIGFVVRRWCAPVCYEDDPNPIFFSTLHECPDILPKTLSKHFNVEFD